MTVYGYVMSLLILLCIGASVLELKRSAEMPDYAKNVLRYICDNVDFARIPAEQLSLELLYLPSALHGYHAELRNPAT